MAITHAPERHKFTEEEMSLFYSSLAEGHSDAVAMAKAGIPQSLFGDLMASLDQSKYEEAKVRALLPVAEVKERMNAIMSSANDPEEPMPPALAMDILERRDAENWGKKSTLTVRVPDPSLPEEEKLRLQKVFGVEAGEVIEGEFKEVTEKDAESLPSNG